MVDDDASDRAAILARRTRFMTRALAGLAGVAGTAAATACPCLKVAPDPEPSTSSGDESSSGESSGTGGAAQDADDPPRAAR